MPRTRPPYPEEFPNRIVELSRSSRTPRERAEEFEPIEQTVHNWNWLKQADRDDGVVDDEPELAEIMADHFISPAALDCMLEDDFDGFIRERELTLMRHISTLVGAEVHGAVA